MKDFIYRLQNLLQKHDKDFLSVSLSIRSDVSVLQITDLLGKQVFHLVLQEAELDKVEPEEMLQRIISYEPSDKK